jgi:hypothetical protein
MRILLLSSAYNLHPGIVGDRGGNSLDWALQEMKNNFWGEDRRYHLARTAFVRKQPRGHRYYVPVSIRRCDEAAPVKGRRPHRINTDHRDCHERLYGT